MIHRTADDYGMHPDINRGIAYCVEQRLIDGIAVSPCGPYLEDLPPLAAAYPHLRVGVHLMLVGGRPLTDGKWMLVKNGAFTADVFSLARGLARGAIRPSDVEREWDAQIRTLLDAGLRLTHLNSHQHVHLLPSLWPVATRLAQRYGIESIRTSYESLWGAAAKGSPALLVHQAIAAVRYRSLPPPKRERTLGMLCSTAFSARAVVDRLVREILAGRPVEVMTHPGFATPAAAEAFPSWHPHWEAEIVELKKLKHVIAALDQHSPGRRSANELSAECRRIAAGS